MGKRVSSRTRSGRSNKRRSGGTRNNRTKQALIKGLLIPDTHHPNHNKRSWELVLRVGRWLRPDTIAILGDFGDADSISGHPRSRPSEVDFEHDVEQIKGALSELESMGARRKVYIEGNHEFRLSRYLMRQAPALFRTLSWPKVLGLAERGWEWVPYRKTAYIGKLRLTHDTGSAGMNAHRESAKAFGGSSVIGHTHRMAYEVVGRFDGGAYLACMLGWLGSDDGVLDYIHEAKAASSWAQGFGVFHMEPGTGVVHVQPVPIINGRCVVEGVLFE